MLILIILLFGFGFIVLMLRYNFFRLPKKGLVILLYHSVDNAKTQTNLDKFTISLDSFEKQVRLLKKLGYQSIKAHQIQSILDNQLYKKNKYVFFTFDDGYKNNLNAAKILEKYGFSAMFFISTAYIGKTLDNVAMLDENDIKKLIGLGMEIGSHAHFHVKLSELSSKDITYNIEKSKEILSKFANIEDFAYPFGNFNDTVISILESKDFKRAYIIGQAINTAMYNPYLIKRSIIRKSSNYLDLYLILTRGRSRI